MSRLVLHIDRLVLRGIDRADARALSAGIEAELQRLLAEPGAAAALAGGGDRHRVSTEPIRLAPGSSGAATGRHIAARIASGVKP